MKTVSKKFFRQAVAMVIVLCLMVSMCPAFFATETTVQKKYVSLGDSMANGYGLTGYGNVNGYLEESPDAYPYKLSQHFGWDLTHQLAMSAMRAEDLHYILEYGKEGAFPGDTYTQKEFVNGRFKRDCGGVENAAQVYQSAVAEADVITLGIGNANFGVFLLGRITNALGVLGGSPESDAWIDFETAIQECDETTKAYLRQIREEVKAKLYEVVPQEQHEIIAPIENAISYAVASYMLNYAGCVEAITNLNPDAEIILVGIMNTFTGMNLSYEGQVIPLGDVVAEAVEAVNLYLSTQPVVLQFMGSYPEATFYYTEATEVDVIVNTFADSITNENSVLRERVLSEVQSMIWPMLNASAPGTYADITLAEVQAYETALEGDAKTYAEYLKNNQSKLMAITVYLAFEQAVIESTKLEVLDANALMKLATGLGDVFSGIEAKVEEHITNNIDAKMMATAMAVSIALKGEMGVADVYQFMALPDGMAHVLQQDDTIMSLLNLFARMLIGNGIGCHPSAKGHDSLTTAIATSYENGYMASDASAVKLDVAANKILDALDKYGPQDSNYYEITNDSYYVALGDGTATSTDYDDYADLFANQYNLDYKNLSQNGLLIQDAFNIVAENKADIAKADLITVGFGNVTLLENALQSALASVLTGTKTEYDWTSLVTEQGVAYVEQVLASLETELINSGVSGTFSYDAGIITIDIEITDFVMAMLENYAYNATAYAVYMPEYVNAVRAINPDATVLVVGMYNPLKGRSIDFDGKLVPIGDMLDNVVDFATVHARVYCALTENVILVRAPEVENVSKGETMSIMEFAGAVMAKFGLYPNEAGHTYIKDQIVNALDINVTKSLIGDVDLDGVVTVLDATEIQRHVALVAELTEQQLAVADVDKNGAVNVMDATEIQRICANA